MSKAKFILRQIREGYLNEEEMKEKLFGKGPDYNELNISQSYLKADEWQEFKRKFVEEYGGEPIQSTGMTHSEFMHYIKTSGDRENEEYSKRQSLRKILKELEQDD